jgi:hypothetical protein
MAKSGIPLGQWNGSDATEALHATIKDFVETSDKQTRKMIHLTWAILVLTGVMLLEVSVQIALALNGHPA